MPLESVPTFGQQMLSEIMPIIATAVGTVVTTALALLSRYLLSKVKNERFNAAIEQVSEMAFHTVAEINQVHRKVWEDGVMTDAEKEELKNLAMDKMHTQIPEATRKILDAAFGNLDEYLGTLIESNVAQQKLSSVGKPNAEEKV